MTQIEDATDTIAGGPRDKDELLAQDLAAAAQLRAIERLRGGLEHELRSPLNAIVLNLELLRVMIRGGGGDNAVTLTERIDVISEALVRLQEGIAEVMGQIEEADRTITTFDLNEVVDQVQRLIEPEMRQRSLTLEVEKADGPLWVRGRPDQQRQVLLQVLINAFEASPAGSRIRLTTGSEDGERVVEVEDFGGGISVEAKERIFDRHYCSQDGKPGIGLFVARNLVEQDGGSLSLIRTGAEGTLFRIRLPEESN